MSDKKENTFFAFDDKQNIAPEPKEEKQPWWNDGDKVGGLLATWALILVLAIATALVVKLILWMF